MLTGFDLRRLKGKKLGVAGVCLVIAALVFVILELSLPLLSMSLLAG